MNHPEQGADCARESTLMAVRDDGAQIAGLITDLEVTIKNLHDHLMGQPSTKSPGLEAVESAPPQGMIPQILEVSSGNIARLRRLQEALNQVCYLSGEGR